MNTAPAVLAKWESATAALIEEMRRDEATLDAAVPSRDSMALAKVRRQAGSVLALIHIEQGARQHDSYGPQDRDLDSHEGKPALKALP